jgi:hypothetical protein
MRKINGKFVSLDQNFVYSDTHELGTENFLKGNSELFPQGLSSARAYRVRRPEGVSRRTVLSKDAGEIPAPSNARRLHFS